MWRKLSLASLVAVLAAPVVSILSAAALTVSPVVIEHDADPGNQIVGTIKLRNEGDTKETYYPSVQDFVAGDEAGTPQFVGTASTHSIVKWISFNSDAISIDPGAGKLVIYTISVPKDATPGGYYGGILFSTSPPTATGGVGAVGATGPLVLVRVSGNVIEKGSISDFSVAQPSTTSLPADFNIRFENQGTVHVKPVGVIRIQNMFGGTSAVIPVNDAGGNVLPNSSRKFGASWSKAELPDNASELMKEWKNFAFGPYTATLVLNYGEGKQVASASAGFWVMPWMLIVLFIILVAVAALLVMQYNKWIVARAMTSHKH